MKSTEIRTRFFAYFQKQKHEKVASSSLIPAQDPTLLFANAGMNQFKDLFLGKEQRSYTRAVTIQKCVRAGGKHNDLDNVGFTKRHLTFFEMMGNFSFGDYFKKEAILFAWEFLTKEIGLPAEKLHASVFEHDDEAYDLWRDLIGLPAEKIHRLGAADNFWQMGDTGPCGPCTEIYIDRGTDKGCKQPTCAPGCSCDRFLEIWNLVFMQFDRQPDGRDVPLKKTGVDTGMGLERICAVAQNVDSVFNTDLFAGIIAKTEELTNKKYASQDALHQAAFHVLADHIRSATMLIADGCAPSNEGRGYVLRKIIRRAALFEQKLTDTSIFPTLSEVVVAEYGDLYPELITNKTIIKNILTSEINKFSANLVRGRAILEQYFEANQASKKIDGPQAFKLYDTYGFPTELIIIMADEKGFTVDTQGFEKEMEKQREQSGKKTTDELTHVSGLDETLATEFTGYHELTTPSVITALIVDHTAVPSVSAGQPCWVITQKSPFFIVGGGQVPDNGWLQFGTTKVPHQQVRYINDAIGALITAPVALKVGDPVTSIVNEQLRVNAMKNHTATHMLQSALMHVLGKQIKQSGSLVHPDYLRFDFTYHENPTAQQLKEVENIVNEKIREDIPVSIEYMSMKEATQRGALAFFGDKYNPEEVRMVNIPDFSVELCGGTHVPRTGVIGTFKIIEVTALSAGHRRIVAVTGPRAMELFQDCFDTVKNLSQQFKVKREEVIDAVQTQASQLKNLTAQIKQLRKKLLSSAIPQWLEKIETITSIPFLFLTIENTDTEELRDIAQQLSAKQQGLYFLTSTIDGKHNFVCAMPPSIDSAAFTHWLKEQGCQGGGSKGMIQGACQETDKLKEKIIRWLKERK